ncbi:MAG: RsmE family RNA methyltransferase [bacterium]
MNSLFILSFSAPIENNFIITGQTYQHLIKVMRRNVGDTLTIAAPDGETYIAAISKINRNDVIATIIEKTDMRGVSPLNITLFQAVIKGDKFELIIQKAAELGVNFITPVISIRTVTDISPEKVEHKLERWQKIADSACEQCERSIRLIVNPPVKFKNIKFNENTDYIFLHERTGGRWPDTIKKDIALFIGPEGGWDKTETELMVKNNISSVNMGKRILRAETAAISAITIIQYKYGDFNQEPK